MASVGQAEASGGAGGGGVVTWGVLGGELAREHVGLGLSILPCQAWSTRRAGRQGAHHKWAVRTAISRMTPWHQWVVRRCTRPEGTQGVGGLLTQEWALRVSNVDGLFHMQLPPVCHHPSSPSQARTTTMPTRKPLRTPAP